MSGSQLIETVIDNRLANEINVTRDQIKKEVRHQLMIKVVLNYKIMRARAKISYKSVAHQQTFLEHWLQTILKTYNVFNPAFVSRTNKVINIFKKCLLNSTQ